MLTLRSFAAFALVTATGLAFAQTPKPADAKASEKGRDWSQIDTNKDGHVSPEEMEKWLAANPGPLKK